MSLSPWPPNPIQHICPLTPTSYQLPFPRPPTFKYVLEEYLWTDVLLSVCLLPGPGSGLTVVVLNVIPAQTGGVRHRRVEDRDQESCDLTVAAGC